MLRKSLLLLVISLPAHAEETPQLNRQSHLHQRVVAFLTGTPPPAQPTDAIPGLGASDQLPSWLEHWQKLLRQELTGQNLANTTHPLLVVKPLILKLKPETTHQPDAPHAPIVPQAQTPEQMACPHGTQPRLAFQTLQTADENTQTWLGFELVCLDAEWTLHRQTRLVLEADAQGKVLRAFGLQWQDKRKMGQPPELNAMPGLPDQPARLDRRQTWLVELPLGGWLAQLEQDATPQWESPNALPLLGPALGTLSDQPSDLPLRTTLVLAEDGAPKAALFVGGLDAQNRVPLWHEGAWDAPLPTLSPDGLGPFLVMQRIGRPQLHAAEHTLALNAGTAVWTHAGYAIWHLGPKSVQSVPLPLPIHDREGLWDCDGDVPLFSLMCTFHALGAHADVQPETLHFQFMDGAQPKFVRVVTGR